MKKSKKLLSLAISILAVFALVISISTISVADVGDFESYDYGDSWSSSDWGSSSWDYDYGYDYDYDYGGGIYFIDGSPAGIIFFFIILAIIIVLSKKGKLNSNSRPYYDHYHQTRTPIPTYDSSNTINKIHEVDPYFNEDKFLSWAKTTFIKLQNAWTARDWEQIRTIESEELFEQHSAQIKRYIDRKQINVMDRIAVNYAKLYSFSQDEDKDTLSILLNSSMADYIIDENTQEVIQGDKITRRTKTYKMTFIRKKGLKTSESTDEKKTTNCPNCGAPTNITSSGKCEYCGSVITIGEHDWVLSNLEPFRN